MQSRWLQSRRKREQVLALFTGVLLAAVAAVTVLETWRDRRSALDEIATRSGAVLQTMESAWSAALREAGNAALSAALLLEDPALKLADAPEARLHAQLQRELLDESGAARLLLTDAAGRVRASSAEFPVADRGGVAAPQGGIVVARVAGRELRLGFPEASPVDGRVVLPLWCALHGPQGGTLRAELQLSQFERAFGPVSTLYHGTTVVLDPASGRLLLRLPLVGGGAAAVPPNPRVRELVARAPGRTGVTELRSSIDGAVRLFSWRTLQGSSLVLARGLDKDAVLAPVWARARSRVAVAILLSVGLVLALLLLARYLRRLDEALLAVARSERRYATAMEASSIGIILMDLQGRWLHANEAMCRMLGYTRAEILALPSEQHSPEAERVRRQVHLAQLGSGAVDRVVDERPVLHKQGHLVWLSVSASLMREDPQSAPLVISHVQDITARRADHAALQALNQELEERVAARTRELSVANADLEAFSYSAAHDLRSPLGRLVSYADILAHELAAAPERTRRWVEAVHRQAMDMNAIIDSLLALARVSRADLHLVRLSMATKVASVVEELQRDPSGLGVRARWQVGELPDAMADRPLVRVVLTNLLGNALKYSQRVEQPQVELGSFSPAEPGMAGYFVRDNGAGFDMAHADGLFKPFKRLHTVSEFPGSGVGLAIVHRAISRLGGQVWAEAEVDRGATFYFTLPAAG